MERPKVIAIDLPVTFMQRLKEAGFNAAYGNYGRIYPSERGQLVRLNFFLPNFTEQEVVFVSPETPDQVGTAGGPTYRDVRAIDTYTDPRALAMLANRNDADRIRAHGGVFVVFASAKKEVRYNDTTLDNWCFLSRPHWFQPGIDAGSEITADMTHPLGKLIGRHLKGAHFECRFNIPGMYKEWRPLAFSKYNDAVAGLINDPSYGGLVIVVPILAEPEKFALDLLSNYLPDVAPELFPEVKGGAWVHDDPYELPQVIRLESEIVQIKADAKQRCAQVQLQIDRLREDNSHLHELLTGSGAALVTAVERTFNDLGFADVVNVDAATGEDELREDLHILKGSPAILIEVKGITGTPSDEDVLAAGK